MQVAFVALKALQWALKGQELAKDTLEILLVDAYHWNPCWKVDEHCHIFGCFPFISTKVQLFLLLILCHDIHIYDDFWLLRFFVVTSDVSGGKWRFSTNHRALVSKVAIFGQLQSSRQWGGDFQPITASQCRPVPGAVTEGATGAVGAKIATRDVNKMMTRSQKKNIWSQEFVSLPII